MVYDEGLANRVRPVVAAEVSSKLSLPNCPTTN